MEDFVETKTTVAVVDKKNKKGEKPAATTDNTAPAPVTPAVEPKVETPVKPAATDNTATTPVTPAAPAAPVTAVTPTGTVVTVISGKKGVGREPSSWKFLSAAILAQHREKLGLSAAKLGVQLGVTQATIYSWEKGNTAPAIHQEVKLAQLFKLPVSEENAKAAAEYEAEKADKAAKAQQKAAKAGKQAIDPVVDREAREHAMELCKMWLGTLQAPATPEEVADFVAKTKASFLAAKG